MECSAALAYKEVPSARLLLPSCSSGGEFPRQQPGERAGLGSGAAAGAWSGSSKGRGGGSLGRPRLPLQPECLDADGVNERRKRERTEAKRRSEIGTGGDRQPAGFPLRG